MSRILAVGFVVLAFALAPTVFADSTQCTADNVGKACSQACASAVGGTIDGKCAMDNGKPTCKATTQCNDKPVEKASGSDKIQQLPAVEVSADDPVDDSEETPPANTTNTDTGGASSGQAPAGSSSASPAAANTAPSAGTNSSGPPAFTGNGTTGNTIVSNESMIVQGICTLEGNCNTNSQGGLSGSGISGSGPATVPTTPQAYVQSTFGLNPDGSSVNTVSSLQSGTVSQVPVVTTDAAINLDPNPTPWVPGTTAAWSAYTPAISQMLNQYMQELQFSPGQLPPGTPSFVVSANEQAQFGTNMSNYLQQANGGWIAGTLGYQPSQPSISIVTETAPAEQPVTQTTPDTTVQPAAAVSQPDQVAQAQSDQPADQSPSPAVQNAPASPQTDTGSSPAAQPAPQSAQTSPAAAAASPAPSPAAQAAAAPSPASQSAPAQAAQSGGAAANSSPSAPSGGATGGSASNAGGASSFLSGLLAGLLSGANAAPAPSSAPAPAPLVYSSNAPIVSLPVSDTGDITNPCQTTTQQGQQQQPCSTNMNLPSPQVVAQLKNSSPLTSGVASAQNPSGQNQNSNPNVIQTIIPGTGQATQGTAGATGQQSLGGKGQSIAQGVPQQQQQGTAPQKGSTNTTGGKSSSSGQVSGAKSPTTGASSGQSAGGNTSINPTGTQPGPSGTPNPAGAQQGGVGTAAAKPGNNGTTQQTPIPQASPGTATNCQNLSCWAQQQLNNAGKTLAGLFSIGSANAEEANGQLKQDVQTAEAGLKKFTELVSRGAASLGFDKGTQAEHNIVGAGVAAAQRLSQALKGSTVGAELAGYVAKIHELEQNQSLAGAWEVERIGNALLPRVSKAVNSAGAPAAQTPPANPNAPVAKIGDIGKAAPPVVSSVTKEPATNGAQPAAPPAPPARAPALPGLKPLAQGTTPSASSPAVTIKLPNGTVSYQAESAAIAAAQGPIQAWLEKNINAGTLPANTTAAHFVAKPTSTAGTYDIYDQTGKLVKSGVPLPLSTLINNDPTIIASNLNKNPALASLKGSGTFTVAPDNTVSRTDTDGTQTKVGTLVPSTLEKAIAQSGVEFTTDGKGNFTDKNGNKLAVQSIYTGPVIPQLPSQPCAQNSQACRATVAQQAYDIVKSQGFTPKDLALGSPKYGAAWRTTIEATLAAAQASGIRNPSLTLGSALGITRQETGIPGNMSEFQSPTGVRGLMQVTTDSAHTILGNSATFNTFQGPWDSKSFAREDNIGSVITGMLEFNNDLYSTNGNVAAAAQTYNSGSPTSCVGGGCSNGVPTYGMSTAKDAATVTNILNTCNGQASCITQQLASGLATNRSTGAQALQAITSIIDAPIGGATVSGQSANGNLGNGTITNTGNPAFDPNSGYQLVSISPDGTVSKIGSVISATTLASAGAQTTALFLSTDADGNANGTLQTDVSTVSSDGSKGVVLAVNSETGDLFLTAQGLPVAYDPTTAPTGSWNPAGDTYTVDTTPPPANPPTSQTTGGSTTQTQQTQAQQAQQPRPASQSAAQAAQPLQQPALTPLMTPQLSCTPSSVPAGTSTPITISFSCLYGVPVASGFTTGGAQVGQTIVQSPANATHPLQFSLTCVDPYGVQPPSAPKTCNVGIGAATSSQATPVVTLVANPTSVQSGGTSQLSWSSVGTSGCEVTSPDGTQIGSTSMSGTARSPQLSATTDFTVLCQEPSSSATVSATASVVVQ